MLMHAKLAGLLSLYPTCNQYNPPGEIDYDRNGREIKLVFRSELRRPCWLWSMISTLLMGYIPRPISSECRPPWESRDPERAVARLLMWSQFWESFLCKVDLLSRFYIMKNLLVHRPSVKRVLPSRQAPTSYLPRSSREPCQCEKSYKQKICNL